ncbi:MAG: NAD(P)-dependent oxidoreductase [Ignavibacteria bacterium]
MKKYIKVLFIWKIEEDLKKHLINSLKKIKEVKLVFPRSFTEKNIPRESMDADVIIGWRPSRDLLFNSPKLKLYINPGTGIKHHIKNFQELKKAGRNILLINGHGHAYSTAQHAVAMLLALMNRIIPHHNWMQNGIWRTSDNKDIFSASVQLRNRRIGLLGYGAINKYVHSFLSGFENEFFVMKRDWKEQKEIYPTEITKYKETELHKFLKAIDILIIAVPHTSKTEGLIGAKELKLLGKNSLIVNIARGTIVNEKDLYDALKNKEISGAALDVWYNYSPEKDKYGKEYPYSYPFHKLKNIVLSPHRAASPFDDLSRWDEVIENLTRLAKGRKDFLNVVNIDEEY